MNEQENRPLAYLEQRIRERSEAFEAADLLATKLEKAHIARHPRPTARSLGAVESGWVISPSSAPRPNKYKTSPLRLVRAGS